MTYALGRFVAELGEPFAGVMSGGRVGRLADILPAANGAGITALFEDWDANVERIYAALEAGAELPWEESELTRLARSSRASSSAPG